MSGRARAAHLIPLRRAISAFWALWARFQTYEALALMIMAVGVVAWLSVPELPRWLAPLGMVFGVAYYVVASYRERRRRRLLRMPMPEPWREVLRARVPLYAQLDPEERRRFEREIVVFLAEQRIYPLLNAGAGPGSDHHLHAFRITDEHRILIAASAATLLLGRPEWRLPTVRDIVVYPGAFAEETYELGGCAHTVGMVHAQGPILLSLPALLQSYPERGLGLSADPGGHSHVGIHEFAHVLDFIGADGRPHGVPGLVAQPYRDRFYQQLQIERDRLEAGQSILDPYGLKNDAELFAVAVEAFFMDPIQLRAQHADLYRLLAGLFNQDPATRVLTHLAHLPPWFSGRKETHLHVA